MIDRDTILGIMLGKGPVIPVQIAKEGKISILFASAMLSELVASKRLKVSSVKVGGSPLYYLPEHASKLQEFSKHLHPKEKEAYELLKKEQILRDSEQEPVTKVALNNMKDFAWPLKVTVSGNQELFWKWYLISNEEAGELIKAKLELVKEGKTQETGEEQKVSQQEQPDVVQEKEELTPAEPATPPQKQSQQRQKKRKERLPPPQETQQNLLEEEKDIKIQTPIEQEGVAPEFAERVVAFFSQNNINVLWKGTIKKGEVDFIIELQSAVGTLKYYCKAKSKRRIGDGDLSSAYVQGELKKLPVLFVSDGEPSKRAKEMLNSEFKNMVFKNI